MRKTVVRRGSGWGASDSDSFSCVGMGAENAFTMSKTRKKPTLGRGGGRRLSVREQYIHSLIIKHMVRSFVPARRLTLKVWLDGLHPTIF
jgi:hypothetical protein